MSQKVHEIARDLLASSKEIMDLMRGMGIEVKNHMATVEDDVVERVKAEYARRREEQKAKATAPKLQVRVPSVLHTPLPPLREEESRAEAKPESAGEVPKKAARAKSTGKKEAAPVAGVAPKPTEKAAAKAAAKPADAAAGKSKPAVGRSDKATRSEEALTATEVGTQPAHGERRAPEAPAQVSGTERAAAVSTRGAQDARPDPAAPREAVPQARPIQRQRQEAVPQQQAPQHQPQAQKGQTTPPAGGRAPGAGEQPRVAAGPLSGQTSRPTPATGGAGRPAGQSGYREATEQRGPGGPGLRPPVPGAPSGRTGASRPPQSAQPGSRPAAGPGVPPGGRRPQYGPRPQGAPGYGGTRPGGPRVGGVGRPMPIPVGGAGAGARGGAGKPGPRKEERDFRSRKRELEERERERRAQQLTRQREQAAQPKEKKPLTITEDVTVKELAEKMDMRASEVLRQLISMGLMVNINQTLDVETAKIVATELGFPVKEEAPVVEEVLDPVDDANEPDELKEPRPPVVTVMGHVDHGKTSLLDAIRKTNVTAREAGGITQHIGASTVEWKGRKIVFLDTPGHEAFTAMRARGAKVTDLAVLVVAADDSVMPQTVEAINHAKAANVPIIVAINKIDVRGADPQRVKTDLTKYGLVVEEWGGDTIAVPVSAKEGTGIDQLLEMILLVADLHELKANPNKPARGTIIEAEIDKGRGPVATVLIQSGTLHVGDPVVAGLTYGKVRAMFDDKGRRVKKAGPSTPVEVLGLADVPQAGDIFFATESEQRAREIAEKKQIRKRNEDMAVKQRVTLEDLMSQVKQGEVKALNVVLKGDVQGSVEAVKAALEKLSTPEVRINVIHAAVGAINESDVLLAATSKAIIVGFNVRPDANARRAGERDQIDIRTYSIIYDLVDDIKRAMEGMVAPEEKEVVAGRAEVRQLFKVPKFGTVAGSYVSEGKIVRGYGARVIRDGIVVQTTRIDSLRRLKDDVHEVAAGYECGIHLENYNDLKEGDVIEAFTIEKVKREL